MQTASSGRRRSSGAAAATSPPATTAVPDLLQQLRALGGMGQGKTYAGMAAAGRSSGTGYATGSRDGRSAFFRPAADHKARHRGTPAAGSVTPPTGARPAARFPTPGSAASPFPDDDILFQMSGLKPLRTASRLEREQQQQQQQQHARGMHRTQSAPAAEAEAAQAAAVAAAGRSPPLNRAFSFAAEPSPRRQGVPLPTAPRNTAGVIDAAGVTVPCGQQQLAGEVEDAIELELHPAGEAADPCTGSYSSAGWARPECAAHEPGCGNAAAAAAPSAAPLEEAEAAEADFDEQAGPAWSEELLNWMLSEKTGLLVEAQRAQRRQQELGAEVERLRARGAGAEKEVQRLLAERRALLDRVQRLSAAEAEASARAERLTMENDALAQELAHSQEVCREMLAARRAARDALADVSAHNCRLLAAYVEKKREAAAAAEALAAHQRESEARIRSLEAQLRAVQAGAAVGRLRSPPPSPPTHSGAASPADSCGAGEAVPCEPHPEVSQQSPPYGTSGAAGSPGLSPQQASPQPDKENQGGNWSPAGTSRRQQAGSKAAQWDEERSELLSLLERLQDQLSAHAELAASARRGSRPPQRQHATPPPSPFCQPLFDGHDEEEAGLAAAAEEDTAAEEADEAGGMPQCSGEPTAYTPATAQRSSRATSNLEASFDSASGSSGPASEEPSAEEVGAGGSSPAVAAHPVFDSPLPPESVARSGAPSPPSVRPAQSPAADEQRQGEEQTPSSRPATSAASLEEAAEEQQGQPIPRARSSAGGSQTLETFLSPPAGSSPVACAVPTSSAGLQASAQQQRLQQAEQRAAELEAELQRLRVASAAAEERAACEERRRAAEAAKAAGNSAFQAQRFEEAAAHYSAGLEAGAAGDEPTLAAVLHCNRAAAHHACGRYLDALADCYRAETLDASYARVYHRRADAFWALGAYDAAAQDLAHLLKLGAGQEVVARLADAQRRATAQEPVNHYAVLGVKPAATPGEIKSAYKRLALVFHPDKAAGAAGLGTEAAHAIFKLLSEAHRVLADAEARRHYDIAALRFKYRRFYSHAGL
ncbi:Chaperone dnaJ isoform B [Chlorella sorokiniana]|uniref:Chaperone dnaJ isoform B n=1 Tax=Chlorella sorokiniana TaxID=3076 RepID=A0A2P6TYC5_CHLSO|nr:Chaperone dnaJ isoform B [Chlorella sorokiniana]|eukprot:PRW59069.1 Chaperone dnaJ isoform B [Chlorella sorokiniana]